MQSLYLTHHSDPGSWRAMSRMKDNNPPAVSGKFFQVLGSSEAPWQPWQSRMSTPPAAQLIKAITDCVSFTWQEVLFSENKPTEAVNTGTLNKLEKLFEHITLINSSYIVLGCKRSAAQNISLLDTCIIQTVLLQAMVVYDVSWYLTWVLASAETHGACV